MLPACLPVQELWDLILGELYQTKKDLQSCSLVCRSLVAPAQALIFHDIIIAPFASSPPRLADIFAASPHLVRYARTLVLSDCDIVYLTLIAAIPWSSLRRLEIRRMSRFPPALNTLIGLESLHHLVVDGVRWSPGQIHEILGHSTPALEHLEFRACWPQRTPPLPVSTAVHKPNIKFLALHDTSVDEILTDPALPFDISGLIHLQCATPVMSPALLRLLRPAHATIQVLEFQRMFTYGDPVDLALFPALRHLNLGDMPVRGRDMPAHQHIQMLAHLPVHNSIHTISMSLFRDVHPTQQEWDTVELLARDLRALDAALAQDRLSALRRVEVAVAATSALQMLGPGEAGWRDVIEDAMPALRERRILFLRAL
ncbi:hypothetical protein C8R46DRAFT_1358172 [Mycena filopes]|nr:hypothetical protein C8R46DRAFT_1358172 [Mycena filopes]